MKVIRYSLQGFLPQKQTFHMEHINYHLNGGFDVNDYPEYMKYTIMEIHKRKVAFYKEHLEDLQEGIWCFIDGHKDNLSLNHLKHKVPCWEAELPDDVDCYDCNWEKITTLNDPIVLFGGCYIPKRELHKLKNIKKRKKQQTKKDIA